MVEIGKIIEYKGRNYKVGKLASSENIIKLKEANEDALVYIQPRNKDYQHEEGVASVVVYDDRLEIMSLSKDSDGVPWFASVLKNNSLSIGKWLDVYELIHIYYGDEILKMIREGKLTEGDKLTGHYADEECVDCRLMVYKNPNDTLNIQDIDEQEDIDSWDLLNMTFQLKQKEYLTFDEARKSGRRFKYRNWIQFQNLREVMLDLSNYDGGSISILLNEKAWEIED